MTVRYYTKVLTNEGVMRESRYEETMLRRVGHVWVERVLPPASKLADKHQDKPSNQAAANSASAKKVALKVHDHEAFNPVMIPRHVMFENGKTRLEYVDSSTRQVIAVPASEYDNVNFDGSWVNAYFLVDPKQVATLPLAKRKSDVAGAVWRERDNGEVFQRVLWDEKRQIPLIVESGDKAGRFFNRFEVNVASSLRRELPWQQLKGYGQKEYADFLD
ncbi:MAG: hypothetical protein HYZ45_03450 [Burkholderiales bacterium]|nr:hypothetical protein [Burkholderiales bacterium]